MPRIQWPTALLLLATANLAVGPRFILPALAPDRASEWWEPLQHAFLFLALLCNLLRYGRHAKLIAWPALVVSLLFLLSPFVDPGALVELSTGSRTGHALAAWVVLALPWLAVVPRYQPQSVRHYAHVLASIALLSAVLGLVLQLVSDWSAYSSWNGTLYRFQGATRGDYFAGLAFGGVVIAVHEWNRRAGRVIGALATVNTILVILSGSRTALIVLVAWVLCYLTLSPGLRARLSMPRPRFWFSTGAVGLALLLYLPVLRIRMTGLVGGALDLSGRQSIWSDLFGHFQSRPWLGMGLGSAQPGALYPLLPHNEFLRLLVEGGLVGSVLYLGAILFWVRGVWTRMHVKDRPWLAALMVALPLYSLTDNPVSACYILPFIYLGALMPGQRDASTS